MDYWLGYLLTLLVGSVVISILLIAIHRSVFASLIFENMLLIILALFLTFMGLEFYFKVFFAEPDSFDTLARENWFERYANPVTDYNSWGYRDIEWSDEMITGKTRVMVVGDSYVHGDGIEYPEDRFSDQLAAKLGSDYVVFNLGKGGTNVKHYIEGILNYPYQPDILVVSLGINDIKGAALEDQWLNRPTSTGVEIPKLVSPLVENSYAINFLYYRLLHLWRGQQPDTLWEWYLSVYNEPDSWWIYQRQMLSIYEGAQSEQIPMFVAVFPSMQYVEQTEVVTSRIINLFQEQGVQTIDVADLIRGISPDELMASQTDAHPNELVHSLVADALYEMFVKEGLVK